MKLAPAIEEFGVIQRRKHHGEDAPVRAAALDALKEYLLDYAALDQAEEVTSTEFYSFLLEYYPSEEEPQPDVADALLDVSAAFAFWLLERGIRAPAAFLERHERLREDLRRTVEAYQILRGHLRRDDLEALSGEVELESEESGQAVGMAGTGLNRLARLDEVDYSNSEDGRYTVLAVQPGALTLQSDARVTLGEPPAEPVRVPDEATRLLRVGDIIHAEIAPAGAGWELLDIFGVRPGGYE